METNGANGRLSARYQKTRARTLRLAESLSSEDQQVQAFAFASPTKWHLAHVTWFFETFVLQPNITGRKPYHPDFDLLFNSYYEGVGPRVARDMRGLLSRPSVEEVRAWRAAVDEEMVALLERELDQSVLALIELGLNHEEQHQELLLTDILANFSVNPLKPAWRDEDLPLCDEPPAEHWIDLGGGVVKVGHEGAGFHFDNETPRHEVLLYAYALRNTPLSNAEVIDFIDNGGYQEPKLWLSDGLDWVRTNDIEAPAYWRKDENEGWRSLTLYGERPIDSHAPATHLSGYEADAIATWLDARLPTEHEWENAARTQGGDPANARWLEDGPVAPRMQNDENEMLCNLWGETWEWTRSAYAPYPGFRPPRGVIGEYNGKFMCNQWVLRGGSCATPAGHIRASYRNFLYPDQRWQFTGVRLAR